MPTILPLISFIVMQQLLVDLSLYDSVPEWPQEYTKALLSLPYV